MPRSATFRETLTGRQMRRCPGCENVYPATAAYFYQRGSGRLERCQGPDTDNCRATYYRERSRRARAGSIGAGRRFGVEIEFHGSRSAVEGALILAGLRCQVAGYGHRVTSHWRVVTDASVSSGGELVSPIFARRCGPP